MVKKIIKFIAAHKIWTGIIVVVVVAGGYYWYATVSSTATQTQYVLKRVGTGTIAKTVTGTGQITAQNQRDVKTEVSDTVQAIDVSVGQKVKKGDLIATLDKTDALNTLESAKIAYAKVVKAPTQAELDSANNSVAQSYSSAYNSITDAISNFQTIISGMDDLLYSQSGVLADQSLFKLSDTIKNSRQVAGVSYDLAEREYSLFKTGLNSLSRSSSTSTVVTVLNDTYSLSKDISNTTKNMQSLVELIAKTEPDFQTSSISSTQSDVSTWSGSINSTVSALLSAKTSITSSVNSLDTLLEGADPLDIQSQQLSLRQAEDTYSKYSIYAPFDGVVGRISVNPGDIVSNGTVVATVVGENKMTTISLNEVDATQAKAGNPVVLTFDAIDGLSATGTVSSVDLVGTVSSGVVSYSVKINIDTVDDQILAGMSVNVVITTQEKSGVIVVPSSAITTQNNRSFVKVVDYQPTATVASSSQRMAGRLSTATVNASAYTPKIVEVTLGLSDDTNTEIPTGLSGGEWIVTQTIAGSSSSGSSGSSSSLLNLLTGRKTTTTTNSRTTSTTGTTRTTTSSSASSARNSGFTGGPPPGF